MQAGKVGQFSQLKEQTGESLFAYRTHNFQTSIYYEITFIRRKNGREELCM